MEINWIVVGIVAVLKSDHCGIEITQIYKLINLYLRLKSDHCGIEILTYNNILGLVDH